VDVVFVKLNSAIWRVRNTLQHSVTHCNALQQTTSQCNTLQHTGNSPRATQGLAYASALTVINESCRTHESVRSRCELVGFGHNEQRTTNKQNHESGPARKRLVLVLEPLSRLVVILLKQEVLLLIRRSNRLDEIGEQRVARVSYGVGGVCVCVCRYNAASAR